jgi:hypothetical protein
LEENGPVLAEAVAKLVEDARARGEVLNLLHGLRVLVRSDNGNGDKLVFDCARRLDRSDSAANAI